MNEEIKQKAINLSEQGKNEELYELIKPYIETEDMYALYLYSLFSQPNESEAEFTKRNISLQTRVSEGGVAEASYRMGVNHLYGDDVEQNFTKATMYFERAIAQGHSYTKFTFGYSIYYGTDENTKDMARGISLMKQAAKEGVAKATRELELIANA